VLTAVVGSALANKAGNGGAAWVPLTWVRGFRAMGIDAYLIEEIASATCVDDAGHAASFDESFNLAFFKHATGTFGLEGRAVLVCDGGQETYGAAPADVAALASDADFVVNISGHLRSPAFRARTRRKIYLDLDPGYTQFWHLSGASPEIDGHDAFFTIGENIGNARCSIPNAGVKWQPTRQPTILSDWPVLDAHDDGRFTTVASWRGPYGPVEHGGRRYGPKAHEFRKFIGMPQQAEQAFEIALQIHPDDSADLRLLQDHQWRVTDPAEAAGDAARFRSYVQHASAEFSVAQGVYVHTASGWFSDRSVRYLASGRPVLVQDTGFSANIPVGEGLLCFDTLDDARRGAARIAADYAAHAVAARRVAEEAFEHERVLGRFCDDVGLVT